jgi:hypothetical protein
VKIGLVSDTHDNLRAVLRAVDALGAERVHLVLHAGDVTQPETLAAFETVRPARGVVVLGNNDFDRDGLAAAASSIGWELHETWAGTVDGVRIALAHGDEPETVRDLVAARPDLLVTGHSHQRRDAVVDAVRHVNPGALHRAGRYSIAILDTGTHAVRFIDIAKDR